MVRRRAPQNPKDMVEASASPPSAKQAFLNAYSSKELSVAIPFITAYGPKRKVAISFEPGFGRTKQSFKDECDVNNIMARYIRTGVLEFRQRHEPRYGDCTGADFQFYMNEIAKANSMFADMPAQLRARFENDPAKFLDFVQNPKNLDEARELGLCKPVVAQAAAGAVGAGVSHREDGSASHEPLRARDGTFREHSRQEKRDEARGKKDAEASD